MRRHRLKLALTATALAGAASAGFSGYFGGKALQMLSIQGDAVDWMRVASLSDRALILFAAACALACVFLYLLWAKAGAIS